MLLFLLFGTEVKAMDSLQGRDSDTDYLVPSGVQVYEYCRIRRHYFVIWQNDCLDKTA